MATYYLGDDGKLTNKKKKKKQGKTYTISGDGHLKEYVNSTADDIAPVKTTTTKKEEKNGLLDGWFKESDGNWAETLIGSGTDLTKNILQGGVQIPELVGKGLLSLAPAFDMAQKTQMGMTLGKEDWEQRREQEKQVDSLIQKDWYNEENVAKKILSGVASSQHISTVAQSGGMMTDDDLQKTLEIQKYAMDYLDNDMEKNSVFDKKSDQLAVSGGQLLGTAGLQAIGVPWWVTTGATSLGGEVENALNNGATHDEAVFSGLVSAGAEILSEKLSGGINFGSKTLFGELFDDKVARLLSQSISNKLVRNFVKVGGDAIGEGFEEVFSEVAGRLGKKLTYEDEKTWAEMFASEEAMQSYIDSFVGGLAMGEIASGSRAIRTEADGVDFTTENTHNEQKVVDAETQKRIEETEKELNKKLNTSEKVKIRKQVQTEMERGELSTDTIESVLGGETYEAYKSSTDEINSLKEQQKALQEQLKDPRSGVQNQAKQELSIVEKRLSELEENYANADFKNRLSSEVYELTKNERLSESYREVARKSQVFEADLTQYDSKTQEAVKRAIDSGILNNTRKTHDFVDLIAKLSAEKGVSFDFTNNEALKNSGFAIEGKTINGLVQGKDVILNIDSSKSLNTVVGHEITHVLEGTELYTELQNMIVEYAKSRGDYDARYKALQGIYKDVKDANIDNELTADLVGDYLFTDESFIRNLSAEKPNIFKKIFEEIKYLYKVATAGSKEARELEKVKRAFEKAYQDTSESKEFSDAETKYSIREEAPPKETGVAYKVFYVKDGKLYPPMVANPDGAETPIGVWLNADVGTSAKPSKTGRPQVKAGGKGTQGGSGSLAFRPGWHLGDLPRASQFDRVNPETGKKELFPENFVWAEVEYAKDVDYQEEAMSYGYTENGKFRHAYAGLPKLPQDGYYRYRTNPKPDTVPWVITGAMKVNRLLSDAEVNAILEENGVAPVHRQGGDVELEKFGFNNDGTVNEGTIDNSVKVMNDGTVVKYSLSTWTPETQEKVRENLVKAGYKTEQVDKWIDDTNGVASVIASDKDRLDFEASDNQTMLKNNQEYVKTLDASTLCAKRLVYQGTFNAIQHRMPNTMLTSDDLINLQNMMKEHGVETPCSVCYVESRRRHLGKFAQEWLNGYEGEYKPNLDEVTTSDGLEELRHTHPQTYKDFVDAMNKKGSANPKVVQLRTEYRNEIMSLKPAQIRKIEAIGGLRVQSFSDFETPHLLDMMQAVMDMSAKGLTSQAYTKVPNFAWVFGDTGIKINLSLIAEGDGFDSNGDLAFSSVEGMDINDAMALRDAYSQNVGTIIVGANDKHILACMNDDRIDYIIPFHRSGWGQNELKLMGLDSYKDYTYGQNEHDLKTGKNIANLYPPDYWDYNLSGKENAERYLNLCATTGREPKFSEFLVNNGDGSYSLQPDGSTDGYWKTLIDFKMYDNSGKGAEQQKVLPNFNITEAYRVLNEYEGGANTLPVAEDVVEEFVTKYQGKGISPISKNVKYSLSEKPLEERVTGDALLDAQDLIAEIENVAEISPNGYVTLYHRTTEDNAKRIKESGKMSAKEDGIFFSTSKDGENSIGYGDAVVELKVPIEKLVLDDIFSDEAHLRLPLRNRNQVLDVSNYLTETKHSLGEQIAPIGNYNVYGKDIALPSALAPTEQVRDLTKKMDAPNPTVSQESINERSKELHAKLKKKKGVYAEQGKIEDWSYFVYKSASTDKMVVTWWNGEERFNDSHEPITSIEDALYSVTDFIAKRELGNSEDQFVGSNKRVDSFAEDYAPLTEELANKRDDKQIEEHYFLDNMQPEMEEGYNGSYAEHIKPEDPFYEKDIWEVGKDRKQKAYMYENPEVKPFFQKEAKYMLFELDNSQKGEKIYNDQLYYDTNGEMGFFGTKRHTSDEIAYLLDTFNYTYKDIAKGLNAIVEDNGKENNAISKRIEFLIDERLRLGYTDFVFGDKVPPNQDYINLLNEKQITEYDDESWNRWLQSVAEAEQYYSIPEEIAPLPQEYIAIESGKTKKAKTEPRMTRVKDGEFAESPRAKILDEEPTVTKEESNFFDVAMEKLVDKGYVFEKLSKKTKNRELEAKYNFIRYADRRGQDFIGKGTGDIRALNDIQKEVKAKGLTHELSEYLYHLLNIDRMTLESRFDEVENKAVFGNDVTAEMSEVVASQLEKKHPEFKEYAKQIYDINTYLRSMLVDSGVISQETADLWQEMYPHYVPIRRVGDRGLNVNVPLDTGKTSVNAPIKRATGGSSDILPLFDTMADRVLQTYKAVSKNNFGVELKNTLGSTIETEAVDMDNVLEGIDQHEELLQEGKFGRNPTFTVFENGERVTFEITDLMYEALKPTSKHLAKTYKIPSAISGLHRNLVTQYNPSFLVRNAIKDSQDVLINSQHPAKTYANFPTAIQEMVKNGKFYQEYLSNGGEYNTYFERDTKSFKEEKSGLGKIIGMPLNAIETANDYVEKLPRLAEYIASRKMGRSIEVSMLDSARVTTNFSAGADFTKFANRNGATFLNASVQGTMQQVRNIQEAKMNGLKGVVQLATKYAVAGLPIMLLNSLLWDDDEEYEELSDYVKQNYYVVAKFGDGQFVRIPKGRMVSVIQDAFEQTSNALTGNDEVDLQSFLQLVITNLAPNNPVEDNILAPIMQVANNKTWYGDDLVPTRLQDVPEAEQFDESTDSISKWLGEKINYSPYKINYLLDQYSGAIGDTFLPMFTPQAESEESTLLAPLRDAFTTDSVLKNQNVSDFYDTSDELTINANRSGATDEEILSNKYINSVKGEIGKLYGEKREIQNSSLSDSEKYYLVRDLQKKINALSEKALGEYQNVYINDNYAKVGDRQYRLTDNGWEKLTDEQIEKQDEVTSSLGIKPSEYWSNKDEYTFAYENSGKYAISNVVGGYDVYESYLDELNDFRADKDENGKSISGSAKEKKIAYINSLDLDFGQKIILIRSLYDSNKDKEAYNMDIVDYLNSREDISYTEMKAILEELDMKVHEDGTITW